MIKLIRHMLLSAAVACLSVSPLLAETHAAKAPPADVAAWVARVNAKIDRAMKAAPGAEGVAQVTFRRGVDGRPTDIALLDGGPRMADAVRRTLAHLSLPPMPAGVHPQQRVTLQLLFDDGSNLHSYERKRSAMFAAAASSNQQLVAYQGDAYAALAQ